MNPARPNIDGGSDISSYVCLIALSICIGSTFFFQSIALQNMGPGLAGALRLIFCAAVLVPLSLLSGAGLPTDGRSWIWSGFNALAGFLAPFYLLIWAQQYVATSLAGIILSVIPLLILALSKAVLGVHISARKWCGLFLGSIGLIILALPGPDAGPLMAGELIPKLAVFMAALFLAIAGIAIRKMPPGPPLAATAAASLIAAVLSAPVAVSGIMAGIPAAPSLWAIAAAGIISTAFGQTLRFYLVRRRGPVFIAPNAYLAALVATSLGVGLLNEPVSVGLAAGFGVILLGLIIAQDGTGKMKQI